ncbi:uncharacterized protein LOC111307136 [Durio zibethinus]|uniref:Uncharacterized protein LOC111307136 n=1 Tax=Durio zibethinus TaxID=66656 RepID=A0A6P6A7J1_DURZI|nr:uncharacterized protein LOC111307136 [Durio zibethinus]
MAELHLIQGDSLLSKTQFLRKKDRGANVDFEKVFDKILQVAIDGEVEGGSDDKERIFVFSGMEFDEASRQNYDHPIRNMSNDSNGQCSGYYNGSLYWDSSLEEDYMLEDVEDDWYAMCEREIKQKKLGEKQQKFTAKSWKSMYGGIKKKFQEKVFNMPEIVFWNLNNSPDMPVPSNQGGVALVVDCQRIWWSCS